METVNYTEYCFHGTFHVLHNDSTVLPVLGKEETLSVMSVINTDDTVHCLL